MDEAAGSDEATGSGLQNPESNRKKGNIYRKMFMYMLRKHTDLSLREIGEMLGMKYRAVSELACYFSNELTEKKPL